MENYYQKVMNGTYQNHVLPFLWQKGESKEIIEMCKVVAEYDGIFVIHH